jgi:hypothetical protein
MGVVNRIGGEINRIGGEINRIGGEVNRIGVLMLSVVTEEVKMGSLETKWRSLGKRDRQHHCFVEIKVRRATPKSSMENG